MNGSVIGNGTWSGADIKNGIVYGGSGILVTFINGIGIFLVSTNRELMPKIKACYIGLLLTDFLHGVTVIIMGIFWGFNVLRDRVGCFVTYYLYNNFAILANMMTLLNSLDRFMVLRFTYTYTSWMTPRKMVNIVTLIYCCGSASSFALLYFDHHASSDCDWIGLAGKSDMVFNGAVILVCMTSTVSTNIYTAKQIWRHTTSIQNTHVEGDASRTRLDIISEKKHFITVTIVIILYVICYLPSLITIFDILLNNWADRITYVLRNPTVTILSATFYTANSLMNPIVHIWRLRSTRTRCRQCFGGEVNVTT